MHNKHIENQQINQLHKDQMRDQLRESAKQTEIKKLGNTLDRLKIETNRNIEIEQQITETKQPTDDRNGRAGQSRSHKGHEILITGMSLQGSGVGAFQGTGPDGSRSPHRIFSLSEMKNRTASPRAAGFDGTYDLARSPVPMEQLFRYQNLQAQNLLSSPRPACHPDKQFPPTERQQTHSKIEPNLRSLQCTCIGKCTGHASQR
jgi:hypothetical protein